jgi:hypothetical protein
MNYNLINEYYFPIKGFSKYTVSNFGNVKNIKSGRILKQIKNTDGYLLVNLSNDLNEVYFKLIHILVIKAFIMNHENKDCVDHIDNDRSNNKLENLRWATQRENQYNRKININNTSGNKGVYFQKLSNKWIAQIYINNIKIHLGSYLLKEDAINARRERAKLEFGEYLNICEL